MIGDSRAEMDPEGSKAKVAARDAIVTGAITLVSGLLTFGYPPTPEILYMTGLTSFLTAIVSYAHALGIKKAE